MTELLPFVVLVVVNPARVALLRPPGIVRRLPVLAAVAGALAVAALSGPALDVLDLEPESFRIAAGAVLMAGGLRVLAFPLRRWDEERAGGVLPLAWPILLSAEVVVATLSWAADDGVLAATAATTLAVVIGGLMRARDDRWTAAAARLFGAGTVAVGVSRVVSGVFSV